MTAGRGGLPLLLYDFSLVRLLRHLVAHQRFTGQEPAPAGDDAGVEAEERGHGVVDGGTDRACVGVAEPAELVVLEAVVDERYCQMLWIGVLA